METIKLTKIEIQEEIIKSRKEGKPDQQIYNELAMRFDDRKALRNLIVGTTTDEKKIRFKWIAHCIAGILIINYFFVIKIKYYGTNPIQLPLNVDGGFFALSITTFGLIYHLYQFKIDKGYLGFFAAFWGAYNGKMIMTFVGNQLYFSIILFTIIVFLVYLYHKKLFPKFRVFGYNKDAKGEYIL